MKKPTAKKIKWILIFMFIIWGLSFSIRFGAYFDSFLMLSLALMIYANE